MQDIANSIEQIILLIKFNMPWVLSFLAILWGVNILNWLTGWRLNYFGIIPRHILGLPGIVLSPWLHAGFNHLFFNTIPLFLLMNFMLFEGLEKFYCTSGYIILLSGAGTWLFGRNAIHVGASGVIMGYWSYLLVHAYQQPTIFTIILAIITLYYFAGLWMNLFPGEKSTSWEGHVIGCISGIATVYLCG